MNNADLSADALLSFGLTLTIAALTLFSLAHELPQRFKQAPRLREFFALCERRRSNLIQLIGTSYKLRYVSFLVLLAILVATVSPVATVLELEQSVVTRACENLSNSSALAGNTDQDRCETLSKSRGYGSLESAVGNSKSHLLQVAMWPLLAVVYGIVASAFISLFRDNPQQPLEEVIEKAPHFYHALQAMLASMAWCIGQIQNWMNT